MGVVAKLRALLTAGQGAIRGVDDDHLIETAAGPDPFPLFDRWFTEARKAGIYLHESMTLATATLDGEPAARQVLLKDYGPDAGFVFYTNYDSRKAEDLDANPRAALLLHWPTLHRQVRIEGTAERTSHEVSEAYHRSRPRGSQIAAWASRQSAEIDGREELERRFREREEEFAGRDVPHPPFWGGYRVVPHRIEFWQGRANRMHDRILYRLANDRWEWVRLSP
ncbi:MAG: pyridoxamine 5'-phosphate oxidase [Gemmatimonadota bacterium]